MGSEKTFDWSPPPAAVYAECFDHPRNLGRSAILVSHPTGPFRIEPQEVENSTQTTEKQLQDAAECYLKTLIDWFKSD